MASRTDDIDPKRLPERLASLPGLDRVREAAGDTPAYLVGGAVRDLLLGHDRVDVDVAVEDDVAEVAARLGSEPLLHDRFATAKVRAGDLEVDLVRTRAESYPHPGALPEVRPAGLDDDLARRDFTINAMAVPLTADPELIDPHGGLEALSRGELRVLHERSFVDDPTRALRAARYASRYGFGLELETAKLIRKTELATISDDRVESELRRLAAEPNARQGFELLADWGLIELQPGAAELVERVGALVSEAPWSQIAPLPDAVLAAALSRGLEPARELASATPERPSQAVGLARGRSGFELALGRALGAEWLDPYVSDWRHVRLEIDGRDLMDAGVPEGPAVGRGLATALNAKLDGALAGRDDELWVALDAAEAASSGG
jgi:tRNA nucleotidyltransferase (CCA-adding enzyme)